MTKISEEQVHQHIWKERAAWADLFIPSTLAPALSTGDFEFWQLIKQRTLDKILRAHERVVDGRLIASKMKLPIDKTKPMELDFIGTHEDGIFIVELKTDKSAERNAFTELLAYSNYLASLFTLSGHRDITNVLIADMSAKVTRQAYLYDLLIADRHTIVYLPRFPTGTAGSLQLELYIPPDAEFQRFTNDLLSHDAMTCVVGSFHNVPGFIDSAEKNGADPPQHTIDILTQISSHAAQLMESERLNGFCFMRKRWKELETHYENSLVVVALNPFLRPDDADLASVADQLDDDAIPAFLSAPQAGFQSRLWRITKRALDEGLGAGAQTELENMPWGAMVKSMIEVVFTHNIGFRPTGLLREAYVQILTDARLSPIPLEPIGDDHAKIQVDDIHNWFVAWDFMEWCGYVENN